MGQRHQAFIIARVVPHGSPPGDAQYRCIGALHHQHCCGRLPLKAATRFMTLIKQEDNATIIREELRAIDGLYGRFKPQIPDIPCPFTHFLLLSAWSTELSDEKKSYKYSVFPLKAGMGSTEGGTDLFPHFFAEQYLILIDIQTITMESPSLMLPILKTHLTAFLLTLTRIKCFRCQRQVTFGGIILSLHTGTSRPTRRETTH